MSSRNAGRDWIPATRTAAALAHAVTEARTQDAADASLSVAAARKPSPERYREVPLDPDGPNAPGCSAKKYIEIPLPPDGPGCKPKKYIELPDPLPEGRRAVAEDAAWARRLGEEVVERFG
jgi:hypothetical protein